MSDRQSNEEGGRDVGGDEVSAKVKGHAGLGGILSNQETADQLYVVRTYTCV